MLLPHRLQHAFFLVFVVTTIVKIDHKEEKDVVQYFNIIPPSRKKASDIFYPDQKIDWS